MEMWGNVTLQHTHVGDTIVPHHTHNMNDIALLRLIATCKKTCEVLKNVTRSLTNSVGSYVIPWESHVNFCHLRLSCHFSTPRGHDSYIYLFIYLLKHMSY